MKILISFFTFILFISLGINMSPDLSAQSMDNPYQTNTFKVDYRQYTINVLDLTPEEITKFDPEFKKFMKQKAKHIERRMKMFADLREELAEDDSQKNEDEDRADFIEEYWEELIEEMDTKKDFFDRLEDEIPVQKAASFFFWDDAVERRTTNNLLGDIIPIINMDIDKMRNWGRTTNRAANKIAAAADRTYRTPDVTTEDYRKYIDAKMEMEFRKATLEVLDLSSEQIKDFDAVFSSYMAKKENILETRLNLLDEFSEEMREDDSKKDEDGEKADFIENYLELGIADMKLKKRFFDKLEDKIGVDKAFQFFLWEDAVENRLIMNALTDIFFQFRPLDYIPNRIHAQTPEVENHSMLSNNTKQMINSFSSWVMKDRGQVDLSHEYTSEGLQSLVKVLEAVKMDMKASVPNFESKKATILSNASMMQKNWKSNKHADQTKAAFTAIAQIMTAIHGNSGLNAVAAKIDSKTLMTKQASTIYQFFDTANAELKKMK